MDSEKRLSIRAISLRCGLPPRVVFRAYNSGDLLGIKLITETGRTRIYISIDDADNWIKTLLPVGSSVR